MRTIAAVLVASCVLAGRAAGGEPDAAGTVAELKELLKQYDAAGGGNTIPIEQALIRLRDARAAAELAGFLGHRRFGFAAAWALSETGDASPAKAVLEAFQARDARGKLEMGLHLGAFRTEEVRAALRAWHEAADAGTKELARAALLRAGDPAVEKETLDALADRDPAACAKALLRVGDSRREDLLDRVAALAKDERAVPGDLKSRFGVRTRTQTPDGWTRETTDYPVLKTVGAVAIEAASRAVSPTTPEITAWWYEVEAGPRFAATPEGIAFLGAYAEASKAAAKAKGRTAREAVAAVTRWLKASDGDARARITGVAFRDGWVVRYRPVTDPGGEPGAEASATVDAEGHVTVK